MKEVVPGSPPLASWRIRSVGGNVPHDVKPLVLCDKCLNTISEEMGMGKSTVQSDPHMSLASGIDYQGVRPGDRMSEMIICYLDGTRD